MLRNSKAFSGFAVDDLAKARAFYETTLGLEASEELDREGGPMKFRGRSRLTIGPRARGG